MPFFLADGGGAGGARGEDRELMSQGDGEDPENRWAMGEIRELGAMVEPLSWRTKAESGTQRPEAETRDPPATTLMETGRPAAIPLHRWCTEGERRS